MEILPAPLQPVTAYDQLSIARRSFVDQCAIHGDAFKAYKAVFQGISDSSARSQGAAWAKDPLIRAALAERLGAVMNKNEVTAEKIVREVASMAFASMGNYVKRGEDGKVVLENGAPVATWDTLTDEQWTAIKTLKFDDEFDAAGNVKRRKITFELHSKNDALDKLMKRYGLYAPEVIQHNHTVAGPNGGPVVTVNVTPAEAAEMYAEQLRISN